MTKKFTLALALCSGLIGSDVQAQKLVARVHVQYVSTGNLPLDSFRYYHSGTKGNNPGKYKIPEFELMEDSMQYYEYNTTTKAQDLTTRKRSYYTGSDFDSSVTMTWTSGAWKTSGRAIAKYASGKPDTITYYTLGFGGNLSLNSRIAYTWSGNNIATRIRQTRSEGMNPTWQNNRKWAFTWSGNDETEYIDSKWSSGNWSDSFRRVSTYSAGKKSVQNTYTWTGSAWKDQTENTYTYDGNSRLIRAKQRIYVSAWEDNQIDTFMFNPGNTTANVDTSISLAFSFGNYLNKGKWGFRYENNKLVEMTSYSWDNTKWTQTNNQDSIERWYYGWNVSVNDVETKSAVINVFPSPASTYIEVTIDGMAADRTIFYSVVDMQGRVQKTWSENAKTTTNLMVSELATGNYVLMVNNGTEKIARQFTVVR